MSNFIFISYAHKDKEKVLPIINSLINSGLEVWYDGGIEVGSEWIKTIPEKLKDCRLMIACISPNYVKSPNCKRETTFAVSKYKPAFVAYLEKTEVPLDLKTSLCSWPGVYRDNFSSNQEFIDKICESPLVRGIESNEEQKINKTESKIINGLQIEELLGGKIVLKCLDEYIDEIVIPDDITVIGKQAFKGLRFLQHVKISKHVKIIDDEAFADCPNLLIDIPNNIQLGNNVINGTKEERYRKKYEEAVSLQKNSKFSEAINIYNEIIGYKDTVEKIIQCEIFLNVDVGDIIKFGRYPQGPNGEEKEIEWRVLDIKNGELFLLSEYCLDYKKYNEDFEDVTWESCTLRKWLNNDFYNKAFDSYEKGIILTTKVTADINPRYPSTNQGNDTDDKVFILSIKEVEKYFKDNDSRIAESTEYAISNGSYVFESTDLAWWWLRSAGEYSCTDSFVYYNGVVFYLGNLVNDGNDQTSLKGGSVRVALKIRL